MTPTTPAVPEPGTWLMMLLGFAMIGSVARQARPQAARS
ncbi:MAG TPA: PEPxxWA-CTERM sorting domain-containing protein [Sphingomicrobium sp.]|nr:PEPxxWA-CTERM sorting domain-containing protein [Sphingomicrobium sp.]